MKKFYTCYNNGVRALISEAVMIDTQKERAIREILTSEDRVTEGRDPNRAVREGLRHFGTPVFTFANSERFLKSPWFTGNYEFLDALLAEIRASGGNIEESGFHVPFSNGMEYGTHGDRAMTSELGYVTTEQQFIETFGVTPELISAKYLKKTAA